ncbi:unnamed protein product [Caenorhabditis brenneri]
MAMKITIPCLGFPPEIPDTITTQPVLEDKPCDENECPDELEPFRCSDEDEPSKCREICCSRACGECVYLFFCELLPECFCFFDLLFKD